MSAKFLGFIFGIIDAAIERIKSRFDGQSHRGTIWFLVRKSRSEDAGAGSVICALLLAAAFSFPVVGFAQTQPNVNNGFHPYGSYEGGSIDSVNLQNGNVILHLPMPFSYPQRSATLIPKTVMTLNSKGWGVESQIIYQDASQQTTELFWNSGSSPNLNVQQIGTGVGLRSTLDLAVHRFLTMDTGSSGNSGISWGHYLTTWDGAVHQLHSATNAAKDITGTPVSYDAIDDSGYHVELTNPGAYGIPQSGVVTDRHGNRYSFDSFASHCGQPLRESQAVITPSTAMEALKNLQALYQFELQIFLLGFDPNDPSVGSNAPAPLSTFFIVDPITLPSNGTDTYTTNCVQASLISTITDVNGNTIYTENNASSGDTLGRPPMGLAYLGNTSDSSGCQSPVPILTSSLYSFAGAGGSNVQVKICYANFPIQTHFGVPGVLEYQDETHNSNPADSILMVSVIVHDGPDWASSSTWSFNYDSYLNITDLGLPLGGSIHYDWTTLQQPSCSGTTPVSRAVTRRTLRDGQGNNSITSYSWGAASNGTLANTLTDGFGNDTVYGFTALDSANGCQFYETSTQMYQGSGSARTLLEQTDTTYTPGTVFTDSLGANGGLGNLLPSTMTTTLKPGNKVRQIARTYDSGPGQTRPIVGNVLVEKETDWGTGQPGALLRQTETAYQWQQPGSSGSSYLAANLLDLPARTVIKDGAGCMLAESVHGYDETAVLASGLGSSQHLNPAPNSVRGNPTSGSQWLAPITGNCAQAPLVTDAATAPSTAITTRSQWFDSGMLAQSTDALGNTTTHSYDLAYAGAYSTKTQNPLGHTVSGTYDFTTGLLTSYTNANAASHANGNTPGDAAHTSNYTYDFLGRLVWAIDPADPLGNYPQITISYPNRTTVEHQHKIAPGLTDDAFIYADGLGRTIHTKHVLPGGNNALVDTTYDALGRMASVTNPYFYTSELTYGVTQSQYDALGRATQTTHPDGSISSVAYVDNCTTTTDEAGKQRRACTDGLGRLITVWEDPNGLNYETDYQYDALGNLLRVYQKGSASTDSTQWRTRLFTYDSLSRLLTAYNPESGLITYFYDANGNLTQKVMPTPNQTGTVTHTISYAYDALNRVTGKAYSWQNSQNGQLPQGTAAVTYRYDEGTNGKGHLTSLTDQAGSSTYTYDILGRLSSESRTIAGVTKNMSYTYNVDGSLATMTYPSGAMITYTSDSAGRLLSAVDTTSSANPTNYVTGATYNAPGLLTGSTYGQNGSFTGIVNTFSFNNRLQPVNLWSSSPTRTLMNLIYDFHVGNGDNGNVYAITNNRDTNRSQSFTYDPLNRLLSAQNAGTDCSQILPDGHTEYWGNSYGYDAWGNLKEKHVTKCQAENLSAVIAANNQLQGGYAYDAAGNMTTDNNGTNYVYDPENRINSAAGFIYTYDADGNRIEKINTTINPAVATLYWYMSPGIVAESDLSGTLQSEYIFFGGERVARKDFSSSTTSVSYYFADHLKTASVITDAIGTPKSESDYYPWGGELQFLNGDSNHYKFTGKERDPETSLDYFGARQYSNGLGRFITPDWSRLPVPVPYADLSDPQSLNQYGYVRSLPTTRVDTDGHACCDVFDNFKRFVDQLLDLHGRQEIKTASDVAIGGAKGGANFFISWDNGIRNALNKIGGHYEQLPELRPANDTQKVAMQFGDAMVAVAILRGQGKEEVAPEGLRGQTEPHGNSLATMRPAEGYTLRDRDTGEVLKYGETTQGTARYSQEYLDDHNADIVFEAKGTKAEMHKWQHEKILEYKQQNGGIRPPLNKSDY